MRKLVLFVVVLSLGLFVFGCGGQAEKPEEATDDVADHGSAAAKDAKKAAGEAKDEVGDAAKDVGHSVDKAADKVKEEAKKVEKGN